MESGKSHLLALDAVRGVAALCVFIYHLKEFVFPDTAWGQTEFLSKSYLAVDLFFLMSGLVIARSYEDKIRGGIMSLKGFVQTRLIRLFPLYMAGLLLGLGYILFKWVIKGEETSTPLGLIRSFALNTPFLPDPWSSEGIFVFNPASWSLSLEWIFNFMYAACIGLLSNRVLGLIIAISGAVLAGLAIGAGNLDMGWSITNFAGGAVRIIFSFSLGVLFYRLLPKSTKNIPGLDVCVVFATLLILLVPLGSSNVFYDLACAFLLFPLIVYGGSISGVSSWAQRLFSELGRVSYALYILHTPLILWFAGIWKFIGAGDLQENPVGAFSFIVGGVLVTSYMSVLVFDEPVRNFLKRRIQKGAATATA